MEGVKSAGRPVWRGRNSWVITPGFCWILNPEPVGIVAWSRNNIFL